MMKAPLRRDTMLLVGLATVCFGSFSWGVCRHFQRSTRMPPGMQVISSVSVAGLAVFLLEVFRARRRLIVQVPAAIMVGALGLFWWAVVTSRRQRLSVAFASGAPTSVLRTGPWRFVRHPFYSAYLMFWSATVMAIGGWTWLTASLLGSLYLIASRQEERRFSRSSLAKMYSIYRRETPMFVPWRLLARRLHEP